MNRYERGVLAAAKALYRAKQDRKAVIKQPVGLSIDEWNRMDGQAQMKVLCAESVLDDETRLLVAYEQRRGR